jgi:hypothetical protein
LLFFSLIRHSTSYKRLFIVLKPAIYARTLFLSLHLTSATKKKSNKAKIKKKRKMPRLSARDRTEMHQMHQQQAQYPDGTSTDLRLLHSLDDLQFSSSSFDERRTKGVQSTKDDGEEGDPGPISWHQRISIWLINEGMCGFF